MEHFVPQDHHLVASYNQVVSYNFKSTCSQIYSWRPLFYSISSLASPRQAILRGKVLSDWGQCSFINVADQLKKRKKYLDTLVKEKRGDPKKPSSIILHREPHCKRSPHLVTPFDLFFLYSGKFNLWGRSINGYQSSWEPSLNNIRSEPPYHPCLPSATLSFLLFHKDRLLDVHQWRPI